MTLFSRKKSLTVFKEFFVIHVHALIDNYIKHQQNAQYYIYIKFTINIVQLQHVSPSSGHLQGVHINYTYKT